MPKLRDSGEPSAAESSLPRSVDVAIVGGGIAGLVAARRLSDTRHSFVVLEARERVGGRTLNHEIGDGAVVEAGGQWIGPTQTAIYSLVAELGLETFPTRYQGLGVGLRGGERFLFAGGSAVPECATQQRIDELAKRVPLDAPWSGDHAAEWDALSLEQWLDEHATSQQDHFLISAAASATLGAPASAISFLYYLFDVHSAGSLLLLEDFGGGAQQDRIVGGSQAICLELARLLDGHIHLSAPVRRIENWSTDRVRVTTDRGIVEAKRVILATMASTLNRVEFSPQLPRARADLQKSWPNYAGDLKSHLIYPKPFWREAGLSGLFLADSGPIGFAMDNSPHRDPRGAILLFAKSDDLGESVVERKEVAARTLAQAFGEQALSPVAYFEKDWTADPWCGGCVLSLSPGLLTAYGASLRPPIGSLHFSGTETSERWCGYMDGAVRSGEHAARAVSESLSATLDEGSEISSFASPARRARPDGARHQ